MKLLILICFSLILTPWLTAQTFTNATGGAIPNNNTEKCFPVTVSGIGNINSTSFGLEKVCINIAHPATGDLEITLKSPNGTVISLCRRRGGLGDNFTNTCFSTNALLPIGAGAPPFTGSFYSETALGVENNGQNADGVWNICIKDIFGGANAGTLLNFALTFGNSPAQPGNPVTVQDCPGAIPICRPIFDEPLSYTGTGNIINELGTGTTCLGSERNSVWYTFTTQTAGIISFLITPKVLTEDYDWAVFNLTNNKCADLLTNPNLDVRCNFSGTRGPTGPNGGPGGPFSPTIPVQAGETYMILVSHFTNTTNGFIIDFSASTSIVFDSVHPTLKIAKPLNPCSTNQIEIETSENVLCNSVKPADFLITGPGGPYSVSSVYSTNCVGAGAYTRLFTLNLNKNADSAGSYQVCFAPAPGSLTDLCGNNGDASCLNFIINPKDTPVFSIPDTLCKGTIAPFLPSSSNNGIAGTWSPALVSNNASGNYAFTATLPKCAIPTSVRVTVVPTPNLGNDTSVSICSGKTIDLTTFYNTAGLVAQWTINSNPVTNPMAVDTTGIYQLQVTDSNNCSDNADVNLIVKPNTASTTNIAICGNQLPYSWNGNSYAVAGNYKDTLANAAGCDSVVTLNLSIKPNSTSTTNIAICSKQLPYLWNGNSYTAAGTYKDTLVNAVGCDSVITVNLSIKPNSTSTTNIAICSNQLPYLWNGNTYTTAGTYKDTLVNAVGCDSVVTLNLSIKPNSTSTTNIAICNKQLPYSWNGNTYTAAGIYKDTLVNAAGCDSILTLNLSIKPNSTSTTNIAICSKQLPFVWNGNIYTAAGSYKDTLVNASGCDSVVTLNLSIKPNSTSTTNVSICSNQMPYSWNGNTYTAAGTYKDTLVNAAGCDSVVTLNLSIKPNSTSTSNVAICSNQLPFVWSGNTYTVAGIYKDTLINAVGCDSVVTLNLSIKPNSTSTTNIAICRKQLPFVWNGNSYAVAGIYKDTLVNAVACDSVVTLNLSIKPNSTSTTNVAICSKQLPFVWNGNTYAAAGTYKDTLVNAVGCDSILTLNLSIKPNSTSTTNIAICSKQLPFVWNGNSYTVAGIYKDTLINSVGCDSVVTLNLSIKPNSTSTTNVAICSKQLPFVWNGNTYAAAGTYKDTLVNAVGCDSILTLNLSIKPNSTSTTNIAICSKQLPYSWNRNTYTAAGIYKDTLVNAVGCDSILTLNLSIKPNSTSTTNIAICSKQLPFVWNGNTYTVAGIYKDTLINSVGCDSVVTLNLSIKPNTASTTNIAICSKQLPYSWNGNTYTAAGTYKDTLVNAVGCDSVVTLNLSIKPNSTSTTNVAICSKQLPFVWNGNSYAAAGIYKDTLINSAGCDSVLTLTLSILPADTSKTSISVCPDSLPLIWNGNSYSSTGTFYVKLTSQPGCDSVATLVFTIKPSPGTPILSSNSPLCSGDALLLTANSPLSGTTYQWTGPNGFVSPFQNPTLNNISTAGSGTYSSIAYLGGCVSQAGTTIVAVTETPIANAGADRQAYEGDTIQLSPTISSTGSFQYKWLPALYFITPDTLRNPKLMGIKTVTYYLTVGTGNLCYSKPDAVTVTILPRKNPFNFPNVFSPNGDGINDKWELKQLSAYANARVEIFNRAGMNVFSSNGYQKPWDGKYNGKPMPAGTYYYVIQPNEQGKIIKGWVTIVR